MELKSLFCPNCGASLEVEDGLDIFFCKYCGYKILLQGQSEAAYDAKVRVKHMEHKERLQERRDAQERYRMEFNQKDERHTLAVGFGILGAIIAMCLIISVVGNAGAKKQERKLQAVVDQIMIDIENEDFADAYVKANSLYWDDSWTSEGEDKWDATRKEIIKQIEEVEKKSNSSTTNSSDEDEDEGGSSNIDVETIIGTSSRAENANRTDKNGFDSSTNEVYTLAGYTVEIPKYWKSENRIDIGFQLYAETSGKVAMLQVSAQKETDDSYPVTFDGLMSDNDNMIAVIESTAFKEVTDYEVIDTGVIKGVLYKGTIVDKESRLSGYGEWFAFASEKDRTWCTLILCQTDNTEYTYTDDFMKVIESIKPVEDVPTETPPTNIAGAPDDWTNLLEKHYEEVKKQFEDAGFTNITCVAHEIDYNENNVFEGSVVNIAIGENREICTFAKGEQWTKDIKIRIDYRVKPAKPASEYEKAFIRDLSNYDLYYMFDTDTKTVVYFGTDDTYIEKGTYTGDFSTGVKITWSHGEWTENFTYKGGDSATLIDGNGWDWEYKVCDVEKAQKVLDGVR